MAYCKCGIRLRRLTCAEGSFYKDEVKGRWVASEITGKMLERECRRPGVTGCGMCVHALNQLITRDKTVVSNSTEANMSHGNKRECLKMGLAWLLNKNRTIYLPTVTSVFSAFLAVPKTEEVSPAPYSITLDDMPYEVGVNAINSSSTATVSLSMDVHRFFAQLNEEMEKKYIMAKHVPGYSKLSRKAGSMHNEYNGEMYE